MSHEAQVILAFVLGVAITLFYKFLKWNWEAKADRKKKRYPSAAVKKITP